MDIKIKEFILDFLRDRNHATESVKFYLVPGDGSKRVFWRITLSVPKSSYIAMANTPFDQTSRRENFAFIMIGKHLHQKGIAIPEIYQHDLKRGLFIMEDMGTISLQQYISSIENPLPIYEKVLEHLFRLQIEGTEDFDTAWCNQTERYDRTVMRQYEADYFKDAYLCGYLGLKKEWPELETAFDHLAETASRANTRFFLHRDFQSRNIIISNDNIGIIDWQGGRLGPLGYDLASLLIDPYAELSPKQREDVYQRYIYLIKEHNSTWIDSFESYYPYLAIQRNLQILGAFSFLTKIMKKQYFEAYIPPALKTLYDQLHQINNPKLSPLRDLITDLQAS